jgi:non-specific serine/threonine protein kinase
MHRRTGELPAEATGFVGRRAELARLAGLLESARLVTVTGPGGVGKTRVALRAAALASAGYRDGVCLVELSGLMDAELLPHTVASCLGLPPGDSQLDAVLGYLREHELLLILDTCEHLLDSCAMLADAVLREAPGVSVLATSRQPLDVPGEYTCAIQPLPVPGPESAADGQDAVELFVQRAGAVVPDFVLTAANREDVVRICRRLDGIPLAIELATVRLRALPLEQLAERLEIRFRILSGGLRTGLPRHKTLRTAIEWSHDLCTAAEQALWARLSVFAGSFELAAAEEVCADSELDRDEITEALIGLVDKSVLLREETGGRTGYRLLDTLREFGAERLTGSGRTAEFQARHVARYLDLARQFSDNMMNDQLVRYRGLRREHANIRAAFEYALSLPGLAGDAAALIAALAPYFNISGLSESERWYERILERFPGPVLERASVLIARCGELSDAQADGVEGIAIAEQFADARLTARGYLSLSGSLLALGPTDEGRRAGAIAQRLLEEIGDRFGLLFLDALMAQLHAFAGEPDLAVERCAQGLRRAAGSGEVWQTSYLHLINGFAHFQLGADKASTDALATALTMKAELGDVTGMAMSVEMLAWIAASKRRHRRAAWLLGAAGALAALQGDDVTIDGYPFLHDSHHQAERAIREALGADGYAPLYQAGAGYPLDQLVQLVISDADEISRPYPEPASPDPENPLSVREREIATLVAQGLSNRDIAERLVVSKRTVDAHVEHIYTKLGINSRVALANWLRPG